MSYLVLARKYRPRNFTEMVGQSVEKAEREPLAGRENRATEQGFMNGPG